MSSVGHKGYGGIEYHRIFADVEQARVGATGSVHKEKGKAPSAEFGCRYYTVADLNNVKKGGWMKNFAARFAAGIMLNWGTRVMINGQECVIGKKSFNEFKNRLNQLGVKVDAKDDFAAVAGKIEKMRPAAPSSSSSSPVVVPTSPSRAGSAPTGELKDGVAQLHKEGSGSPAERHLEQAAGQVAKSPSKQNLEEVQVAAEEVLGTVARPAEDEAPPRELSEVGALGPKAVPAGTGSPKAERKEIQGANERDRMTDLVNNHAQRLKTVTSTVGSEDGAKKLLEIVAGGIQWSPARNAKAALNATRGKIDASHQASFDQLVVKAGFTVKDGKVK